MGMLDEDEGIGDGITLAGGDEILLVAQGLVVRPAAKVD